MLFNEIYFKALDECQAVVAHDFNPSTLKTEAGGFSGFQGKPGLQSEFQESQGCTEKSCLKKIRTIQKNKR